MNFVILGCGRVGSRLATMLDRMGHNVSIIDKYPDAFKRLPPDYGGTSIIGVGIDEDVLRSAGIEQADVFAAVTNGDNTNIMASQVAKELFHVPRVIARIYDPLREETYHALGLETICPTTLISNVIVNTVLPGETKPSVPAPAGTNPANVAVSE
ncbi:MAG TPA: TrkA family potassium uptake protein [Chloroflexia bacterium]|nr:TrkA family potassium uptake protein [Chloroflexia bacterium]